MRKGLTILFVVCLSGIPAGAQSIDLSSGNQQAWEVNHYAAKFQKSFLILQREKAAVLQYLEEMLIKRGIPVELKNLAIIESHLNLMALSPVGAAGPWQLMPETARERGLVVNSSVDERVDLFKSTPVALNFIAELYERYRDWNMVVAAYNCGPGRMDKAIKQAGSDKYDAVCTLLPAETRTHVQKFIAASYVMNGKQPQRVLLASSPVVVHAVSAPKGMAAEEINASFDLDVIADKLNIRRSDVRRWNKNFQRNLAKGGSHQLILPKDKMPDFLYYRNEILRSSIERHIENTTANNE